MVTDISIKKKILKKFTSYLDGFANRKKKLITIITTYNKL